MNEEEAFFRKQLRRLRTAATCLDPWYQGQEVIFRQWPEAQAEAIIKGIDYKTASILLVRTLAAMGELHLEDEVCPDCGCTITREEVTEQKMAMAEKFLKERFGPLEVTREVTMPLVKGWLESIERYMVNQGYQLPKWERPEWLKEMEGKA